MRLKGAVVATKWKIIAAASKYDTGLVVRTVIVHNDDIVLAIHGDTVDLLKDGSVEVDEVWDDVTNGVLGNDGTGSLLVEVDTVNFLDECIRSSLVVPLDDEELGSRAKGNSGNVAEADPSSVTRQRRVELIEEEAPFFCEGVVPSDTGVHLA